MVTLYQLTWESDLNNKETWRLHESPMSVTTDRIAWVLRQQPDVQPDAAMRKMIYAWEAAKEPYKFSK